MTNRLPEKLDAMAERLIDRSNNDGMDTKDQVDIFKATSTWALGRLKVSKGEQPEGGSGTFDAIRNRINGKESLQ